MAQNTTKKSWGGPWTEEKLDAFEKYVKAYLVIMNKYRDLYGWRLVYFDGFAGSGSRSQGGEEKIQEAFELFGQEVTVEDFNVYQGAAERVVKIESEHMRSFDDYYFVDKSEDNCKQLEERLSGYKITGCRYHLPIDANEAVRRLASKLRGDANCKALAFLDPFGMQIDWESIDALNGLSVDLWILVPTGVIINRLLERKIDKEKGLAHADKLESFFGITREELRSFFYTENKEPSLFGENEMVITKAENSIKRIAQLYVERLRGVFQFVTSEPLVLYNKHNVPIYHLIFASKKPIALKIAQDIIRKQ